MFVPLRRDRRWLGRLWLYSLRQGHLRYLQDQRHLLHTSCPLLAAESIRIKLPLAGLKPTFPVITDVGMLVIAEPANIANGAAVPRSTVGCAACAIGNFIANPTKLTIITVTNMLNVNFILNFFTADYP